MAGELYGLVAVVDWVPPARAYLHGVAAVVDLIAADGDAQLFGLAVVVDWLPGDPPPFSVDASVPLEELYGEVGMLTSYPSKRLRFQADSSDQEQVIKLGGVQLQIRARWDARCDRWRLDFSDADGASLATGLAVVPGLDLLAPRRPAGMPRGVWLVEGPYPYQFDDLASGALTIEFIAVDDADPADGFATRAT